MKLNKSLWRSLFKQTIGSYLKYIVAFVFNIILVLICTIILDLVILLSEKVGLFQVVLLALINVLLVLSIGFSFVQLHRFLVGKTISKASNALLVQYVHPLIDSSVLKISQNLTQSNGLNESQVKQNILYVIKQEHVSKGLQLLTGLIFRRMNLQNLSWDGTKENLSQMLKDGSVAALNTILVSSRKYLYFLFALNWLFVIILLVFRYLLK